MILISSKGFSLVELLIAVALSSLISLGLYGALSSQQIIYSVQDDISEMQQNLRLATERISRDVSMAGFGRPSGLGSAAWPLLNGIAGLDYSIKITGTDCLDIVGCLDPPDGHCARELVKGTTCITLAQGEGANFNTSTKSDISIGGKENAKIVNVAGDTLTVDTNPLMSGNQGLAYNYAVGVPIYSVKYVTYSVDRSMQNETMLRVDEHRGAGRQQVAQCVDIASATLSGNILDLILMGRTAKPDRTTNRYMYLQIQSRTYMRNLPTAH